MSAEKPTVSLEPRITLDDLRHQAESVKSRALTEAKDAVDSVARLEGTRTLLIVAGVVVVAASFAFLLGSRSGRAIASERMLGE